MEQQVTNEEEVFNFTCTSYNHTTKKKIALTLVNLPTGGEKHNPRFSQINVAMEYLCENKMLHYVTATDQVSIGKAAGDIVLDRILSDEGDRNFRLIAAEYFKQKYYLSLNK